MNPVERLEVENERLADETDRLRIVLANILVEVNASSENTAIECRVRVIATRALLGKSDRVLDEQKRQ